MNGVNNAPKMSEHIARADLENKLGQAIERARKLYVQPKLSMPDELPKGPEHLGKNIDVRI